MTGHNIGNEEYTVCFRSGLQEWKAVLAGCVGHTTIQGHSRGNGHTSPAQAHTSVWVCACVVWGVVVPAGQLKNSAEWRIATAWDSKNT